jgi:hypothetical protein
MKPLAAKIKTMLNILRSLDFASKPRIIQTPSTNLSWVTTFYCPVKHLNLRLASVFPQRNLISKAARKSYHERDENKGVAL